LKWVREREREKEKVKVTEVSFSIRLERRPKLFEARRDDTEIPGTVAPATTEHPPEQYSALDWLGTPLFRPKPGLLEAA